jgi:hypothetical protein
VADQAAKLGRANRLAQYHEADLLDLAHDILVAFACDDDRRYRTA